MLAEFLTVLVGLVPPAVKYVGGVIGSEVLDRRAKRLENKYGGLFQDGDAELIGHIAATSALLARFDAIARTIETPKKTKSSAVSGTLAAVVFYGLITFVLKDANIQPAIMLTVAFVFVTFALAGSTVWDWFFTALKVNEKYTVQMPHKPEVEAPPVERDRASYRKARSGLQSKMLSQMSGVMDVLSKSEILGKYADNSTPPAPLGAKDKDGKPYAPYAWEVADLLRKTPELAGAEAALPYIVSQRSNPRFKHDPVNLAHAGKVYSFSFKGNGRPFMSAKHDMAEFNPRRVEENVPMLKYLTHASVERWRKDKIHVHSDVESTFWLPPEIKTEAVEPAAQPKGPFPLDNPG